MSIPARSHLHSPIPDPISVEVCVPSQRITHSLRRYAIFAVKLCLLVVKPHRLLDIRMLYPMVVGILAIHLALQALAPTVMQGKWTSANELATHAEISRRKCAHENVGSYVWCFSCLCGIAT